MKSDSISAAIQEWRLKCCAHGGSWIGDTNKEKLCYQYISVEDKTAPIPTNKASGRIVNRSARLWYHIDLDTLKVDDCSKVTQAYNFVYTEEGKEYVQQGPLPAKHIWVHRPVSHQCIIGGWLQE